MSSGLKIKLLGELTLSIDGTSITGVTSERLQSLLAFLLLHRNTSQSRQQVAVQLWPEVSDTEAKANLRRRLHELKQKLPGGDRWLRVEKTTVQWVQDDNCWLDVAEFDAATEAVASLQTSLQTMTAADVKLLEQAAKLYQGDLLPSCYDDWIEPHRDQLRQQAITVLDTLIPQLAEHNQVRTALGYAQQLQRLDPLYEPAYCHLMRLHTQEGDRASALRVYHQCMTRLQDELGVPPSPTTCQIYEELLRLEDMPQPPSGDTMAVLSTSPSTSPPTTASVAFPADITVPGWERIGSDVPAAPSQVQPVESVRPPVAAQPAARAEDDDNRAIYIERPPLESLCHDTLLQPGALVRVKSPALMGKTLMMDRILAQLATESLRTVRISMEMADRKTHFSDLNRFLRWLCINISRLLAIPNHINDYWDEEGMGSKMSCSTYMEEYLLTVSDEPLVICLDDIDVLFSYPDIYEDFFGLLRSWYEQARTYTSPIWKQLRLAIVHATDVYIPLNINQSPFNVGVPIELPDFTDDQAQSFAAQHQVDHLDIAALIEMVGGHPYLLQQAFEHLKRHPEQDLATLLKGAPTDSGIYANHLRDCWLDIRDHLDLKTILKTMITTEQPVAVDAIMAHQLHSMGVIKLQGNLAQPRCQLYREYFKTHLDQLV
ncbi:AAA-like domain-containing protein [Leptolyngbya ectocarpi]|uniref:AAA-like domain-containing protein n=1 Tax=Leptolyngbya ectocarpi TaxID=1202 RepID=UPI002AD3A952|nr:AAA-like domain-containing protein [Leptolyngbya ectocarpi]